MADNSISPLLQRLIEEMAQRAFSPKTHWAYVRGVKSSAALLHRSPGKTSADDLQIFYLYAIVTAPTPRHSEPWRMGREIR